VIATVSEVVARIGRLGPDVQQVFPLVGQQLVPGGGRVATVAYIIR